MSKVTNYCGVGLIVAFGTVAAVVVGVMLNAFVLTYLWSWFVVPAFGLPQIGIAAAAGISLIVSYLTHQWTEGDSGGLVVLIGKPVVVFALGYVISYFM